MFSRCLRTVAGEMKRSSAICGVGRAGRHVAEHAALLHGEAGGQRRCGPLAHEAAEQRGEHAGHGEVVLVEEPVAPPERDLHDGVGPVAEADREPVGEAVDGVARLRGARVAAPVHHAEVVGRAVHLVGVVLAVGKAQRDDVADAERPVLEDRDHAVGGDQHAQPLEHLARRQRRPRAGTGVQQVAQRLLLDLGEH